MFELLRKVKEFKKRKSIKKIKLTILTIKIFNSAIKAVLRHTNEVMCSQLTPQSHVHLKCNPETKVDNITVKDRTETSAHRIRKSEQSDHYKYKPFERMTTYLRIKPGRWWWCRKWRSTFLVSHVRWCELV